MREGSVVCRGVMEGEEEEEEEPLSLLQPPLSPPPPPPPLVEDTRAEKELEGLEDWVACTPPPPPPPIPGEVVGG